MTDTKLSQLSSVGALNPLTDTYVTVRGGNTDVLVTPDANTGLFNVKNAAYGAKGDGAILKDVTTTSGSSTISSASYTFVAGDVGKCAAVFDSSNLLVPKVVTTIASISSGNAVLTSHTGITTITGTAVLFFGTDDTNAFQTAVNAANPTDNGAVGQTWKYINSGTIYMPAGMYMITSPIIWRTNVSLRGEGWATSILFWISTHTMGVSGYEAIVTGLNANGSTRIYKDCEFYDFGWYVNAGFTTSYSYIAKCIDMIFAIRPLFNRIYFYGSPATACGLDYVCQGIVTDCVFESCGHLWSPGGGGGSAIDWQTNTSFAPGNYESSVIANNVFLFNGRNAVRTTDNSTVLTPSNYHRVIANNVVISNRTDNNGIEDNGGIGVIITGNHIYCTVANSSGFGIASTGGIQGLIENNYCSGWWNGIEMDNELAFATSQYSIRGNTIVNSGNLGMSILVDSPNILDTLNITDNYITNSNSTGIAFVFSVNTVQTVTITNPGSGYTAGTYALGFSGGGGTGAAGTYTVNGTNTVVSTAISAGGTGYTSAPAVTFPSGGGTAAAGTAVVNTPGIINNLTISDNTISNNALTTATDNNKSGILFNDTVTGLQMQGNYIFDNSPATQRYGITIKSGVSVTKAFLNGNKLNENTTSGINNLGTLTGWISNNPGYNPIGVSAVTPGASPWTYTAGSTPEVLYLIGGTVSGVVKNGITLATALSVTQSLPITLDPGEAVVITYTVAPTANKDQK